MAILRLPQHQRNRLGQVMLIRLILPRSETFESTGYRLESWLAYRGGRQDDDERGYTERETGVDGGSLGSQIVDHVLPILADTSFAVQCLAVEDDPRPVRAAGGIVVLRTYSTDDPGRADFHAIRFWGVRAFALGLTIRIPPGIAASAAPKASSKIRPNSIPCPLSKHFCFFEVGVPSLRRLPDAPDHLLPHSARVVCGMHTSGISRNSATIGTLR